MLNKALNVQASDTTIPIAIGLIVATAHVSLFSS